MSYEGRIQAICTAGHYMEFPENYGGEDPTCECGAPLAWINSVDDTNCDAFGIIPPNVLTTFLLTEEVTEQCNLGCRHTVALATYRIPSEAETAKARHYWADEEYSPIGE